MDDDLFAYSEPAQVASPCVNICVIEESTGWCVGCGRSGDEIEEWPNAGDARRQAIINDLPPRMWKLRA